MFTVSSAAAKPKIKAASGRKVGLQGSEQVRITIGQDLKVVEHINVYVHCPASGIPRPVITWLFNDQPVDNSAKYQIEAQHNRLIVHRIETKDTGQYMCVAENSVGRDDTSSFVSIIGE